MPYSKFKLYLDLLVEPVSTTIETQGEEAGSAYQKLTQDWKQFLL